MEGQALSLESSHRGGTGRCLCWANRHLGAPSSRGGITQLGSEWGEHCSLVLKKILFP